MNEITGKVLWFDKLLRYGFISRESGPAVFCHYKSIIRDVHKSLEPGDEVVFKVVENRSGPQARGVRKKRLPKRIAEDV